MNVKVKPSNDSPFPKRLLEARMKVGISQKALGIAAGIDEFSASPRMNQYEKGIHTPPFSTIEKIAEILNVPVPYFFAEDDDVAALLLRFHTLNEKERKSMLDISNQSH